jgi:hypothetical protein
MSNVLVLLTSERCGHCRNMRGSGRLLSQTEIKRDNKQPNIPGGNHYDAVFMKKLITAEVGNTAKLRVINIHYKTFNPAEGVMDYNVFTLDGDGVTVKQTMIKEKDGIGQMTLYAVGESGKVVLIEDINTPWSDFCKKNIPVNISNYAFFYPSLILFEGKAWTEGLDKGTPIYGHLNGFETKNEIPYGGVPGQQPNVLDFGKFVKQFFDGTKELRGSPIAVAPVPIAPTPVVEEVKAVTQEPKLAVKTAGESERRENYIVASTPGANRLKYRLYVVEK